MGGLSHPQTDGTQCIKTVPSVVKNWGGKRIPTTAPTAERRWTEALTMAELKPCPFCGRKPSKVREHKAPTGRCVFYTVECKAPFSNCGVKPKTEFFRTEEAAIEAWNRRGGAD